MNIKEELLKNRPNLSEGSLKTYESILKNLHKKVFKKQEIEKSNFDDFSKILNYLKDIPPNKRKTILSALVVLTEKNEFRNVMNDDVADYNEEIKKQEKTETQRDNWITMDEILQVFERLENNARALLRKTDKTDADMIEIQNYLIVALVGGIFIPPRRSLDYCAMKIKNINKDEDNYISKNKFVFNKYKTAKTYGRQELEMPQQLKNILNRWIEINDGEYLLRDTRGNPLNSVKLNQYLNKIFGGRKIAVNAMRHSYLTDKYSETSQNSKKLAKDMEAMGSSYSPHLADTYIKLK
jgi:regulator of sigma D